MMFGKHHLAIDKDSWQRGELCKVHNAAWAHLEIDDVEPTWENFSTLIQQIETGVKWAELDAYQQDKMVPVLAESETRLLLLKKNQTPVGYALVVSAEPELKNRFWAVAEDKKVIAIENLALFEGQRGNGVGKAFFEMVFADLFEQYDTIYWGTSDFNADSLVPFYRDRMGMTVLDYDPPAHKEQPRVA